MPNYVQVQSYATCQPATFREVLGRFRAALEELGCTDQEVLDWLSEMSWPTSDDDSFGDIYASTVCLAPNGFEPIECSSLDVSLYTRIAVPSLEDPPVWIGFNLVFKAEELKEDETAPYKASVGRTLWQILLTLGEAFFELGVYFTDEWQENLPWRTLVEERGDPWNFEMALFPRGLARYFKDVPAGFKGTVIEGGFGFAQANRWEALPWSDAPSI